MKTLKDFDFKEKRVLLRLDLNVPIEQGVIQDDFRITQSIPTIAYLAEAQAKVIIIAHLGRPRGKENQEFTLQPIAEHLEKVLQKSVTFIRDPIGQGVSQKIEEMQAGDVALLENIRFYPGEEENNSEFAKQLAGLGDIYVNDAFGVNHRAHASTVGIPEYLPSCMGQLLEKEIAALQKVSKHPEKPLVVAVGGAKVETKASFLKTISEHANAILLGDLLTEEVKEKGIQVSPNTELVYAVDGVDGTFDLGPKTIELFQEKIAQAKTVFWAGPLGMIEKEKYEKGSLAIADAIIQSGAYVVAGGGDLAAFLGKHNLREKFDHVSTGGGAMLAFLTGEELPGLKALEK